VARLFLVAINAPLERIENVGDIGRLDFFCRLFYFFQFSARLGLDHFHQLIGVRVLEIAHLERLGKAVDERLREVKLFFRVLHRMRCVDIFGIADLIGKTHLIEDEHVILGPHGSDVLLLAHDKCRNTYFAALFERITKERVGFFALFERLNVVRFVVELSVDLILFYEFNDVDELGLCGARLFEISRFKNHVLPICDFVAFNDIFLLYLAIVVAAHLFITDRAQIILCEQAERERTLLGGTVETDRNIDQSERNRSVPYCSHRFINSYESVRKYELLKARYYLYMRAKNILIGVVALVTLLGVAYFGVFGRALQQDENHLAIALSLPRAIVSADAVQVDATTFLSRRLDSFKAAMEREGFEYVEQMGAALFFKKGNGRFISSSRMYSSYFMLFSKPEAQGWECNSDGFLCPDGSTVGRTGSSCEFTACPPVDRTEARVTTHVGGRETAMGLTINPREVVSDSRCPEGVQCIWAGTVEVKTAVSTAVGHGEHVFKVGEPRTVGEFSVMLTDVTPYPKSGEQIAESSYRFTYDIKKQ
jgi:hypothetical protein